MAWVQEFSGISNTQINTLAITVPAAGVASGHFLALGIATFASLAVPVWTITDSRNNTWTIDPTYGTKNLTGAFGGATMATCKVTTSLQAGDTITLTSSAGQVQKIAAVVEEFDDTIGAIDTGSTNDNNATTTLTPNSGSFTTTQASELIVGTLDLVSQARIYTPDAGWTAGTKIVTTAGTSDRGVQMTWRYTSSAGTYNDSGKFNTAATFAYVAAGYALATGGGGGGGGTRTGYAKVWNGSAWVSHPAKVWNGSAWVIHPMVGYDGTDWIEGK